MHEAIRAHRPSGIQQAEERLVTLFSRDFKKTSMSLRIWLMPEK